MKRLVLALLSLIVISASASAMTYEQAREQALFLTDKMAYELNLTPEQYDAAYEVNFDYLRGVTTADDVFGVYWEHRNIDLGYILLDWQYRMFTDCLWFYRPLYWDAGIWHFRIYGRYPYRDVFYFDRPVIYINYYGGHCWRHCGGSWYSGRTYGHPSRIGERGGSGMRNNWDGRNRSYSGHSSSTAHSGSFTPASRNSSHATGGNGGRTDNRGASATTHDGRTDRVTTRGTDHAGNGADSHRGGANGTATQGGHSGSFHKSSDGTSTRTYGASTSSDKGTTATRSNDNQASHQYGTVAPSSTRSYGSSSSSTRSYGSSSPSSTRSYGSSSSSTRSYGSPLSSTRSYGSSSRSYGGYSGGSHSYGGGRSGGFSGGHSGGHSGGFGGHGGRGR